MTQLQTQELGFWIIGIGGVIAAFLLIYFYKRIRDLLTIIANDTLKRWDPVTKKMAYSRTSLTMLSAWVACLTTYIFECIKNGFNEVGFYAMIGVALGSKLTDAWSKKMSPTDPSTGPTTSADTPSV